MAPSSAFLRFLLWLEFLQFVFFSCNDKSSFAFSSSDGLLKRIFFMLLKGVSMKSVTHIDATQMINTSLRFIIVAGLKNRMSFMLAIESCKIGI